MFNFFNRLKSDFCLWATEFRKGKNHNQWPSRVTMNSSNANHQVAVAPHSCDRRKETTTDFQSWVHSMGCGNDQCITPVSGHPNMNADARLKIRDCEWVLVLLDFSTSSTDKHKQYIQEQRCDIIQYLLPVNSAWPFLLKRNLESLYPQPFHFIISCLWKSKHWQRLSQLIHLTLQLWQEMKYHWNKCEGDSQR